ncbi:UNVERIFIED_CONTAM: hypothetical protein PYX00_002217 [Menopon gallinae]|uniref:Ubiquitin carboxyl-terminal hydrolase n=1 Tax=Menopon gallinae TaxID=328185 RepID=A0AAW2IGW6_9NEOP
MSYSGGSVAALWSPTNYNTAKMPVASTRRYFSTPGTSYRNPERSYLSPTSTSYQSATRDYRSRLPTASCLARSSTSVPTSYSRLSESHEASGKYSKKEANDSGVSNYPRSKTDSDVSALEKSVYKSDSYKYRTDAATSRFQSPLMVDSKYSPARKYMGGISLDTRLDSVKTSKLTDSTSRLQRKDSLTRSEKTDTSPSPIRSLERKSSSSVTGGSSSPIEIRKSTEPLHGQSLKRVPNNLKNYSNNSTNVSSNHNNSAYSNQRRSPDPVQDVSNNVKKNSLEKDFEMAVLSPEKKEPNLSSLTRLTGLPIPESAARTDDGPGKAEVKREVRKGLLSNTLSLDNRNDLKGQSKRKLEKLLSKPLEIDPELLGSIPRLRRSPEAKPKDLENETRVIELRKIEPFLKSPFEASNKIKETEKKNLSSQKVAEKSPQKSKVIEKPIKTSPVRDMSKASAATSSTKESDPGSSPGASRKEYSATKPKKSTSLKDEKETNNVRARELNKRLLSEETVELKLQRRSEDKSEMDAAFKETPLVDKIEMVKSINSRTLPGPSSYQNSNIYSRTDLVENAGIHGTSPRLGVGYNRNSSIEKAGLNGLRNIGNTCFMNSVIQCLSNTRPLLEYLLNEDYLSDINTSISQMKGALIKAFSNVIQELWAPNAEDKIINTINFKSQIQRFAPRFMGYSQQDAQEFLRYLLEGLHEDVNRITVKPKPITTDIDDTLSDNHKAAEAWKRYLRMDDSKVVDIFVGQLKSTLQCTVCGHCSVTFDPFWDLSLPMPNRNGQLRLSSCLDAFTKEEVLDGDEKPTCSKCKTRRKCTKSFSIQKFPKILVLHLKRFSPTERYRGKLSVMVEFPLTNLDLSPYASNKVQCCTYNLYAISNHSGTAYSGHYTAYCKHPYTGNWHEYNDSGVSSLSSRSVVSGEAYVLFYELAA